MDDLTSVETDSSIPIIKKRTFLPVVILSLLLLVMTMVASFYYFQTIELSNQLSELRSQPSVEPVVSIEEADEDFFCGGFIGKMCPEGYVCEYDGDYPDASGTCIESGPGRN